MKNYLWKNFIVFICIVSTLLLQGFSCYAAASEADTSEVSRDYVFGSSFAEIDNADIENVITVTESIETKDAITEEASTETEDAITEEKNAETEEAITEAGSLDIEDVTTEDVTTEDTTTEDTTTEDTTTEDTTTEMESTIAEDTETEGITAKADNADTVSSSSAKDSADVGDLDLLVLLEEKEEEIVSVEQPTINEYGVQPFDFIMDPQRLITATNGAKYGNISFEEGCTLYFRNMEGNYNYSSRSDQLTIKNRSTVPVIITLTASLQNYDGISLTNDPTFQGDNRDSLYMALVDDKDHVVPLSESGEVKIVYEMNELSEDDATGETIAERYSFGLVGTCNPNGSWEYSGELPQVVVTWEVEPIISDEDVVVSDNSISDNSISMNSVSDNSISMNGVSDNSILMNGVSDNSISMNVVSDNSILMDAVSDNSISMNGISVNNLSENGEVLPLGEQSVENYLEETGADIQESVDIVSDNIISENNVSVNNGETETATTPTEDSSISTTNADNTWTETTQTKDSSNIDAVETESTLTEDSVLTDTDDTDTETEIAPTKDSSNTDASKTAAAEDDSASISNASGDDVVTAGSLADQAPTDAANGMTDSAASTQTVVESIAADNVGSGTI